MSKQKCTCNCHRGVLGKEFTKKFGCCPKCMDKHGQPIQTESRSKSRSDLEQAPVERVLSESRSTECECGCWTCRMVGDLKHCRSEDCTLQKTEVGSPGLQVHIRHCIKCDFCIEHNEHCFEDNPALEEKRKAYIQGIRGLKNKKLPVGERYIKLDDALAVVNSNNLK